MSIRRPCDASEERFKSRRARYENGWFSFRTNIGNTIFRISRTECSKSTVGNKRAARRSGRTCVCARVQSGRFKKSVYVLTSRRVYGDIPTLRYGREVKRRIQIQTYDRIITDDYRTFLPEREQRIGQSLFSNFRNNSSFRYLPTVEASTKNARCKPGSKVAKTNGFFVGKIKKNNYRGRDSSSRSVAPFEFTCSGKTRRLAPNFERNGTLRFLTVNKSIILTKIRQSPEKITTAYRRGRLMASTRVPQNYRNHHLSYR